MWLSVRLLKGHMHRNLTSMVGHRFLAREWRRKKKYPEYDYLLHFSCSSWSGDCLDGLVVKASASRAEGPGFKSLLRWDFSGSSHVSDSKIGSLVATLPGAWRYRVSTVTGRPGVSILWLGEVESLICNFYLSVAAHRIIWAYPSVRYTSLLLGC